MGWLCSCISKRKYGSTVHPQLEGLFFVFHIEIVYATSVFHIGFMLLLISTLPWFHVSLSGAILSIQNQERGDKKERSWTLCIRLETFEWCCHFQVLVYVSCDLDTYMAVL